MPQRDLTSSTKLTPPRSDRSRDITGTREASFFLCHHGATVLRNVSLAPFTTFRVGGLAQCFCEPNSAAELASLLRSATEAGIETRILGGGSNLLIREGVINGLVIRLSHSRFRHFQITDNRVIAAAGAALGQIVTRTVHSGLCGLEALIGIPGTLGGAIRGNAGGREGDVAQRIVSIKGLDIYGNEVVLERAQLHFSYRTGTPRHLIITAAELQLSCANREETLNRMRRILDQKRRTQPLTAQSGGCIFKNSRSISSRTLIEHCDLSGKRIGGASVCSLHPNFIVTAPGAKAEDVLRLIDLIRETVSTRMNIELELEIAIW